jgi:hypothetical protein
MLVTFLNQKKIPLLTLQLTQIRSPSPRNVPKEKKKGNVNNVLKSKKNTFQLTQI